MASASAAAPRRASRPLVSPGHSHGPLKYASAQDLPSYPSPGLKPGDAAASAAATLGWASNATDAPVSGSLAGSSPRDHHHFETPRSADALLAAGWAQRQQKSHSPASSSWVSTAANLAFQGAKASPTTAAATTTTTSNGSGARPRSRSSPQSTTEVIGLSPVEDSDPTPGYALSAATIAHRPSMRAHSISAATALVGGEGGAVPYTTMDRQMFTANPPVKPETDERNRAYVLHASALAMARKMYDQQKMIDKSSRAHVRSSTFPGGDVAGLAASKDDETEQQQPQQRGMYTSLQETAYRLAQERLSKLQEEHDQQRGFHEYYTPAPTGTPSTATRTKFGSLKGKLSRRRSSSDGDLFRLRNNNTNNPNNEGGGAEDKQRSDRIRKQMSLLNNQLTSIDEDKRTRDRQAVLAAAQRNVRARLQQMDDKVLSDTGRVPKSTMDDWGRKALVAAQAKAAASGHGLTNGQVDVGGGKMVERAQVDRVAARNVQPLLDEINELAEAERVRLEEERVEEERRREEVEGEKMREREVQEIHRKLKEQQKEDEKARKAGIKHDEKVRKEEAKAIRAEQQHQHQHQHQHQQQPTANNTPAPAPTTAEHKRLSSVGGRVRTLSLSFAKHRRKNSDEDSAPSPTTKVRTWLSSKFPRARNVSGGSSKSVAPENGGGSERLVEEGKEGRLGGHQRDVSSGGGFIGGVALARQKGTANSESSIPSVATASDGNGKAAGKIAPGTLEGKQAADLSTTTTTTPQTGHNTETTVPQPQPPSTPPAKLRKPPPSQPSPETSTPTSTHQNHDRSARSEQQQEEESSPQQKVGPSTGPSTGTGLGSGAMAVPLAGGRRRVSPVRGSRFSEVFE
ncbi:uncharacterized protein C8A04DRAFT_33654 [Dichotomopilus funicola]|uniref:Uncharacterized protein n=1 Tax=Dichotomopilus funicola TaxID=1934379 RepID=A0AAN6VBB7_9PEZI|nr:hypothetical protein C8A04DRAFT_33654 [Dichotomopilus funicola]